MTRSCENRASIKELQEKNSPASLLWFPPIPCFSVPTLVDGTLIVRGENSMPLIEDVLAEKTYKQGGLDVGKRVFYTLIGEESNPHRAELHAHRNSTAIALLFQALCEKRHITEKQLDEILLNVVS
jgi:hypothetical protein